MLCYESSFLTMSIVKTYHFDYFYFPLMQSIRDENL